MDTKMLLFTFPGSDAADSLMELLDSSYSVECAYSSAECISMLPANIYLKDSNGKYVFCSQTWHHLKTDDDPGWSIRGKTDIEIRKDKNNAKLAMESDLNILHTGKGTSYIIEENDGKREFLQLIKEPLFHEDGRVRGIIALINDVTEQEEMRRELVRISSTDRLTGLYNRTCFEDYLTEVLPKMEYPVSIITGDCDDLKFINDTYGHQAGDKYIRMCADALSQCMTDDAVMFRTGGDEFIVLLPSCSGVTASALISSVRSLTSTIPFMDRFLSISLGASTIESASSDVAAAIKESDDNMYTDKRSKKPCS